MALIKDIILDNGITLSYHRIVSINKITNSFAIIEVCSYINKEYRIKECEILKEIEETHKYKDINIFTNTTYINLDYKESENIEDYYNYLKTVDDFKDAIDDGSNITIEYISGDINMSDND